MSDPFKPLADFLLARQVTLHRSLVWQLVKRDVLSRYRGSWMGLSWSFLTPLLMLAVYTFVFREVFQARWGEAGGDGLDFALRMYAGLVVFNFFAECVTRSPRLIVDQPNLVKKVVFPLHLLAWVSTGSGLFHLAVNTVVLLLAAVAAGYGHPTMLLLPLVWLPLLPLILGLTWFLAALGVYLRDIGQVTGLVVSLMMFMSPIFYPVSALPERWRFWLHLNPLTLIIENTRHVVLDGTLPQALPLLAYLAVALVVAMCGAAWFHATRKGFADVI